MEREETRASRKLIFSEYYLSHVLHESGLPLAACRGCAKPQPLASPRSSRNDRFFVHVPMELQGLGFMRTIIEFEAGLALP